MSETIYYTENESFLEVFGEMKQKTPEEIMDNARYQNVTSSNKANENITFLGSVPKVSEVSSQGLPNKTVGIGVVIIISIMIWYFLRRK